MAHTQYTRNIPNDEFLAIINANNPSATNPFVTVTDLVVYTNVVKVDTYADLPLPSSIPNSLYYVKTTTGSWWWRPTYKPQGFYYSDGLIWTTTPVPYSRTSVTTAMDYTIDDFTRNVECLDQCTITIPLLTEISHNEDITIVNGSTNKNVTLITTSEQLLADVTEFVLYPYESLTFFKGQTSYLVKC